MASPITSAAAARQHDGVQWGRLAVTTGITAGLGAVAGGLLAFGMRRTPQAVKEGVIAGTLGGAAIGAAIDGPGWLGDSETLRIGIATSATMAALCAAMLPGFKGMPVTPGQIAFEAGLTGALLGAATGGVIDIAT